MSHCINMYQSLIDIDNMRNLHVWYTNTIVFEIPYKLSLCAKVRSKHIWIFCMPNCLRRCQLEAFPLILLLLLLPKAQREFLLNKLKLCNEWLDSQLVLTVHSTFDFNQICWFEQMPFKDWNCWKQELFLLQCIMFEMFRSRIRHFWVRFFLYFSKVRKGKSGAVTVNMTSIYNIFTYRENVANMPILRTFPFQGEFLSKDL